MNLEAVEQKCFDFLQLAANPLVPVSTLLRYLWQDDEFSMLTENELLDFLKSHQLFHVIDLGPEEPEVEEEMKESGIPVGPRVVLKSRIPTKTELAELMREQMEKMIQALEAALHEAQVDEDFASQGEVAEILDRAQKLREELGKLFE